MNNFKILVAGLVCLTLIPSIAQNVIADSLDRESKQNNSQPTQAKTDRTAPSVTIEKLAPVFYIKDRALDSDRPNLENLTMGLANKGEVVTIITKQESMFKVRFNATDKIGWVSQTVLSGW